MGNSRPVLSNTPRLLNGIREDFMENDHKELRKETRKAFPLALGNSKNREFGVTLRGREMDGESHAGT